MNISDKVTNNITSQLMEGKSFNLPDGYHFVDENGNKIEALKIALEKDVKEYPKSYEECLKVLGFNTTIKIKESSVFDYDDDIVALQKLKRCRDAYWKIAGEKMGLGKSWKPNFTQGSGIKYSILFANGELIWNRPECVCTTGSRILAFPTAEIRDAFYENFKELIEQCKELL